MVDVRNPYVAPHENNDDSCVREGVRDTGKSMRKKGRKGGQNHSPIS